MTFTINGNFRGRLCGQIEEPLSNALVKIYRANPTEAEVPEETQDDKYHLQLLNERLIRKMADRLLGSGTTNESGDFEIELFKDYFGGPIEIHLAISKVPGQEQTSDKTVQFKVRRLEPVWRGDIDRVYSWHYRLPYAFWTKIRSLFDAWMLCGYVKADKDLKTPVQGVRVSVKDADWMKDDFLGTSITDETGYFRIDYKSKDFKKTYLSPLINLETPFSFIPGPGVYFKIETANGQVLYEEKRKQGKAAERRNIARCHYVDLYLPVA